MGQVVKPLTFGHDSTSNSGPPQRKMPSKMIQTSILRYISSDRQHLVAENPKSILLRLPYDIRRRIYEYAGLTYGNFIGLNYEYPSSINGFLQASDAWHELTPPHGEQYDVEDNDEVKIYEDEDEIVECEDGDKISECEDKDEYEISEYSQRVSRFLDGPMPYPEIRLNRVEPRCCKRYWDECDCDFNDPLFPSQLLDVCRVVSDEVEHIFYSENHFNINGIDAGHLSGLFTLKPRALSWLTSLSIELYICTCILEPKGSRSIGCFIHEADHEEKFRELCIPGHEKLIQRAVLRHKFREMTEWKKLCRRLASFIVPRQLKLWVTCGVARIDIAKEIIAPMLQLPVLRACTLRFGSDIYLDELQEIARDAVLKLTGRSSGAFGSPFRFSDLPPELKLHILQYTDLVAHKDLAWCPDETLEGPQIVEASNLAWNYFEAYEPYRYVCCGKCSDARESCCCSTMNPSFSTTCTCWRMPTSLFSVNREMREDSIAIFYSRNQFLILPPAKKRWGQDWERDQPLEILRFFTRFAASGRKYLQSVTWMLPELEYLTWNVREDGEWDRVVDICARELSLHRLSLTLDLSYQALRRRAFGEDYRRPLPISELEEDEWDTGLSMVESMARYKGWKNVYVHLSWPWHNPHNPNDPYSSSEEAQKLREQAETVLEQQVMGPDHIADGKYTRRHAWNGYHCSCEDCGGEGW